MLSIDYSLTVPYPIALQEILDVYLWLLSGKEEVKDMLGFHPKKIILTGDSCGAFLAISLVIVLNELNKMLDNKFKLPTSIIGAYPVSSISNLSASKTLFTFEPLVQFHMYLLMVSVYGANKSTVGDFKKIEKTELFQKIVEKNKHQLDEKANEIESNNDSPWFNASWIDYLNRSDYMITFFNNPFINPISYQHFDELKETSLFLVCADEDFLLDDGLDLAKKWKGTLFLLKIDFFLFFLLIAFFF